MGGIAPGSAQPARSAQLRPASPLASRPRLRDSAPRAKRAHRSGPAQRSPIRGLGPQTQPTRMRHRLNGFLVPPTPPHGVRQRGQVTTTPTGPLAAPQLASLASRVMACAPLAGTNVGFKLRGLQYVVSGVRPPPTSRGPDIPPRAELETRSHPPCLRDKRSGGGGAPPTHPRCSPAGDENGVRPPWAAHHYLHDSGLCGRGASSIGRPGGTVGWPWNSRLESRGLTLTRTDVARATAHAATARPVAARWAATRVLLGALQLWRTSPPPLGSPPSTRDLPTPPSARAERKAGPRAG